MKKYIWILSIALTLMTATAIYFNLKSNDIQGKLSVSYNDNTQLKAENSQLRDNNVVLIHKANLKSFANEKELQRFLSEDDTNITFANTDYASEACINLMKNARDNGYWFGMFPCNTTNENILVAALKKQYGTYIGSWDMFAMTIVGDDSVYLIDPLSDTRFFKLMSFGADFRDYYTPKPVKSKLN